MLSKILPVIESMERRELLSVVWTQGWTNFVRNDDFVTTSYYQWFQKDAPGTFNHATADNWMQDYSWLGKGFEPVTFNGQPAVNYVGRAPYVVDPAAMKKWSVDEFLAEYPHAFDRFDKDVVAKLDWFMVITDADTGVKTLEGADFVANPEGSIYGYDGGTLDGAVGDSQAGKVNIQEAKKVKHKKKHGQRHHKSPLKKQTESLFMDRRVTAVWG